MNTYNLIGLGIGPFHLSLAALCDKVDGLKTLFLEKKPNFSWHPELMFEDADMQTSCFKDLVTSADPTSPYSFLNYLVSNGLYFSFLNTNRMVITRREFELYCQWAAKRLEGKLAFDQDVLSVEFKDNLFHIQTKKETFTSQNISIATGHRPRYPRFVDKNLLSDTLFHAKSGKLDNLNLKDKKVVVIGGGQTGLEIFTHALKGRWQKPSSVILVSKRSTLAPLDESNFTNEYFTPNYVDAFFPINETRKEQIVKEQKLASDGNTPSHLESLYRHLYLKNLIQDGPKFHILPMRECLDVQKENNGYKVTLSNFFIDDTETLNADVVILATGFEQVIPDFLKPITHLIHKDESQRFVINKNFDLSWDGPASNKIYALNFSRHGHGISEPQTSLMAWRSAMIINDLTGQTHYFKQKPIDTFVQYTKFED